MESIWFITNLVDVLSDGPDYELIRSHAPAGDMPPLHVHERDDEGFFVLDGELTLWVGDTEPVVLGPGGFLNAPAGIPHTFRVTSDGPATWLVAAAPGFVPFVRNVGVPAERHALPVLDGPPDAERIARIAAMHRITLLGPPGMLPSEAARAAA
jgi:mannose-6-phosphate isomerase-like protein (cupin superfamily)